MTRICQATVVTVHTMHEISALSFNVTKTREILVIPSYTSDGVVS